MALVKNFKVDTDVANSIALNWTQPVNFNVLNQEIIITRSITHYPCELFNDAFPDRATDSRPVEIFRGYTIVGLDVASISVTGNVLTDTSASFPTLPKLTGRLLRDSTGSIFKITDNTATTITLNDIPANGKYVILADFPNSIRNSQIFEFSENTTAGPGFVKDLVQNLNGSLVLATFADDELANLIFVDAAGAKFIVKSNTQNIIYFYETTTPSLGVVSILSSSANDIIKSYIDTFKADYEANARSGSGLEDDKFYYYTAFCNYVGANVAQAQYATVGSNIATQASAISVKNNNFGEILYNYWPTVFRELDTTDDLRYLMEIFGFQFSQLYSLITTYKLQDADTVFANALVPFSEQTGLPSVGFTIGADTLRRIAGEMLSAWKLKGSKDGIALFIKIITTWDITNGTGDTAGAILDILPNLTALRFFDSTLGITNSRLTQTIPVVPAARFVKSLPGVVIPGFFTFREFVVTLPNIALYLGSSKVFTVSGNNTTMIDTDNSFGATNSLVGNFLLPNQQEINDIFEIVSNTATSITVKGVINNLTTGGSYVVLSPLNANRFIILNRLLPYYIPFGTKPGFQFV